MAMWTNLFRPSLPVQAALTRAVTNSSSRVLNDVSPVTSNLPDTPHSVSKVYFIRNTPEESLSVHESLKCLRAYSIAPGYETVELSVTVSMALKKRKVKDPFRGSLVFPQRFGRERKVLLIGEDEVVSRYRSQVSLAGGEEMIKKLENESSKTLEFDICLCTPGMLDKIKHLQKILRAKMPNFRRGTVIEPDDMEKAILAFKESRDFNCDKFGVINMAVGKLDISDDAIKENVIHLLDKITEHRDNISKDLFLPRAKLSTQFGPGFNLSMMELR